MPACPTTQVLRDLLAGRLRREDAASVEAHLETCADCQQALERATALPPPFAPGSTAEVGRTGAARG